MFHKAVFARALMHRMLYVSFDDGAIRIYDVAPLIATVGAFGALEDDALFEAVRVDAGGYGLSWSDDIDLSADEIYENGAEVQVSVVDHRRVIDEVAAARREAGVSQERLAAAAGLRQPAVARLERGDSAPQLDTMLRVLAPLGKTLRVVDIEGDDLAYDRAS